MLTDYRRVRELLLREAFGDKRRQRWGLVRETVNEEQVEQIRGDETEERFIFFSLGRRGKGKGCPIRRIQGPSTIAPPLLRKVSLQRKNLHSKTYLSINTCYSLITFSILLAHSHS